VVAVQNQYSFTAESDWRFYRVLNRWLFQYFFPEPFLINSLKTASSKYSFNVFIFQERGDVPAKGPQVLVGQSGGQKFPGLKPLGLNPLNYLLEFLPGGFLIPGKSLVIGGHQGIDPIDRTPFAGPIRHRGFS
jgi:hypothetical protein